MGATADLGEGEAQLCFGDTGFALSLEGEVTNIILEQGKISVDIIWGLINKKVTFDTLFALW